MALYVPKLTIDCLLFTEIAISIASVRELPYGKRAIMSALPE